MARGLCGHPVVRDPGGQAIAIVARANNILEQHFATSKQALRRRLGRARLARDLADQPAQAALTANLLDPAYMQILCGSLDQLPHAFAALEGPAAADPPRLERNNRDAALRRRCGFGPTIPSRLRPRSRAQHFAMHPEPQLSNGILTW